jgi:hypothetical protein
MVARLHEPECGTELAPSGVLCAPGGACAVELLCSSALKSAAGGASRQAHQRFDEQQPQCVRKRRHDPHQIPPPR